VGFVHLALLINLIMISNHTKDRLLQRLTSWFSFGTQLLKFQCMHDCVSSCNLCYLLISVSLYRKDLHIVLNYFNHRYVQEVQLVLF